MNQYIKTPTSISYHEVIEKNYTLSCSQYMDLVMPNKNFKYVKDFLSRPLKREDLGEEIGSLNYIGQSSHYFLRTKALQAHSFLPDITSEAALPMMPQYFVNMDLKEGDILISKDSNIGETVILDKDYPNYMTSGAIYRLPVTENKYYLLAFLKHPIFREQLDFIVPKGATIRHAKTLFLDCKIPMPNRNTENTILFVELLTQAIIAKEKLIRQRHQAILQAIETELMQNQLPKQFEFSLPTYQEVLEGGRLDTGLYSKEFKNIDFNIKNYNKGYFQIEKNKIKSGSTPDIRYIGSIKTLKYQWVTPTNCSDYGTLTEERINLQGINNINQNCILLINRTSKGGVGEYVGIAGFYNYQDLGKGHHNQGMYQVIDKDITKLVFMLCFLNCGLMRKYCSHLSVGSKMKELKTEHFLQIPFPNFPTSKQSAIARFYHNPLPYDSSRFNLSNFLEEDNAYNSEAGIYELDKTAKYLQKLLNQTIDDIVNDREVKLQF